MSKKVKYVSVVVLISIIVICFIRMLGNNDTSSELSKADKGSYSYYYTEPAITTEDSTAGINFYGK